MKEDIEPVGNNFEAVITFKGYCDKKDQYYVYKINNRQGNSDKPSFAFKTSEQKATMAFNMDRDGKHYLCNEFCFFKGQHKCCPGFVTLAASVYNPLSHNWVTLAIMEAKTKNTENVSLFLVTRAPCVTRLAGVLTWQVQTKLESEIYLEMLQKLI